MTRCCHVSLFTVLDLKAKPRPVVARETWICAESFRDDKYLAWSGSLEVRKMNKNKNRTRLIFAGKKARFWGIGFRSALRFKRMLVRLKHLK